MHASAFDPSADMCYCQGCVDARGDADMYDRGDPPRPYIVPVGWIRLGLAVDPSMAGMHNLFEKWHNAYHGTSFEKMLNVFKSGRRLLKAGDVGMGATTIPIGACL